MERGVSERRDASEQVERSPAEAAAAVLTAVQPPAAERPPAADENARSAPAGGGETGGEAGGEADVSALEALAVTALGTIFDPEIPVNIYELGLIYDLDVSSDGRVKIQMTLTSPACPVAGSLPGEVEAKIREIDGVTDVEVELVWDPPWTPDRMTEAARLELGFM